MIAPSLPEEKPPIIDVWSRTAPKYRRRAAIMLTLAAVLFGGLCCFTYWLRTGDILPWASDDYSDIMLRSFRPAGAGQVTLTDFLSAPISVRDVPVHGVIMGLLFATLSSIPILVAILYRFPSSILFALMVVFLAAMPWLGLTVLGGCVLASMRRLRFNFRYASALLGLIPVGLYFVMASWEPAGTRAKPVEGQALLYAPWVLALLSSCVICALTLAMAKLINYRPGGISPIMGVLFAIPVILFHLRVGRDELEYRILERDVGLGSGSHFRSIDVGALADREALRQWGGSRDGSFEEIKGPVMSRLRESLILDMENDRSRAVDDCDAFMERFSHSKYIPNVLYLKGQAMDRRVNRVKLMSQYTLEFRADEPSLGSQTIWQTIQEKFPGHELTAMALYKLGWMRARQERFDESAALLNEMIDKFDVSRTTTRPARMMAMDRASMFQRPSTAQSLGLEIDTLVRQARRLSEMVAACRGDAAKPASDVFVYAPRGEMVHPLSILLSLDETHPDFEANLAGLVRHFPDSQTARYAEIRLVLMEPAISRRISRLRILAETLSGRPAGAEAMFDLADVLQEDSVMDEARGIYGELIKAYPDSYWSTAAKDRLASLALAERATG
ncbi:MAG TPA: tetratricopeptide repeat protein [Phycisphaerae bacterium]|nr:tetratricopeptide repeat protein [Phycisphaerae bacterium]